MKKSLIFLFFISSIIQAQYTVKGNINSVTKKHTYIYLYKIEGPKKFFVKSVKISKENNKGTFQLDLPSNTKTGIYRAFYDLHKGAAVEFIFNKENIEFSFDIANKENTIVFKQSKENQLYRRFSADISSAQYKVDSLQEKYFENKSQPIATAYKKAVNHLNKFQKSYEQKASGMLAYHLIKATKRYNSPTILKDNNTYFNTALRHFYDYIDFNNKHLYNSSFLADRIADYIFYMNYSKDPAKQEKLYKKAIDMSLGKISNIPFKADMIEYLTHNFIRFKKTEIVDYLFVNHFEKLPKEKQNLDFKKEVLETLAVSIGKTAPDFSWEENGKKMSLSSLKDGENYLLIFYSTGCSHCLREIPQVFDFMKGKTKAKVVAFAMETTNKTWLNYKKSLPGWHHVLGLNKWENKTARTYQINSTPTYFVLGKDKKIIATPLSLGELRVFLKKLEI